MDTRTFQPFVLSFVAFDVLVCVEVQLLSDSSMFTNDLMHSI